jgi:hypothetical protein
MGENPSPLGKIMCGMSDDEAREKSLEKGQCEWLIQSVPSSRAFIPEERQEILQSKIFHTFSAVHAVSSIYTVVFPLAANEF